MQINKTDNVIFLKGIESNLIEEAFIVLKSNIKLNIKENNQVGIQNKRIDILKEAELILSQEIEKNNQKYEKFRIRKLEHKNRILKITNIVSIISIIFLIVIK